MSALLAAIAHVLACVLDTAHCAELVDTEHGLRCAAVAPRPACPASVEPAGWHVVLGGTPVCTRACGPADRDDAQPERVATSLH